MRHRRAGRKLGRTSSHRLAMLRNLVTEFLDKGRLITTVPKAKELRPYAEKMITLGKRQSLHARRQALAVIRRKAVVHKLFDSLGPRFAERNGGYTRIIRLGYRRGDNAEMALIELVGEETTAAPAEKKKSRAGSRKSAGKKEELKSQEQAAEKGSEKSEGEKEE